MSTEAETSAQTVQTETEAPAGTEAPAETGASTETEVSAKTGTSTETEASTEMEASTETEATKKVPASAKPAVKLNKTTLKLKAGKTYQLKVKNASSKIKWSSSDKKVAKVSQKGLVTAKKAGRVKITALVGKKKLVCKVRVLKNPRLTQTSVTLEKGETLQLKLKDAEGEQAWKTNNSEVATVTDQGLVTAVKKGNAKIIVRVDGKRLVCRVKVTKQSQTVKVKVTKAALVVSKKVKGNPNCFYNPDNVSYKKDTIAINPYYAFIKGGRLYVNCYVINGYSKPVWNLSVQKLAFWHSDGSFAEASFRSVYEEGRKIPGNGGKIRWEFVYPAGRFTEGTDLRKPLGALYAVTAHMKK